LEAPLERGARVKRRPHWLNNTVDPALAAQNRVTLTNECELAVCLIFFFEFSQTDAGSSDCPAQLSDACLRPTAFTAPACRLGVLCEQQGLQIA
jgi:hypothetical protein